MRLSSVRGGRFRNHHPFGKALRRFLNSGEPIALLPGCGWVDGGCFILREALILWSNDELNPGATLRRRGDRLYVDHGFAWIDVGAGRVLVDGDGLQDEEGLRRKLEHLEGVRLPEVRYARCTEHAVGIPVDVARSKALAELLRRRFGAFHVRLIDRVDQPV